MKFCTRSVATCTAIAFAALGWVASIAAPAKAEVETRTFQIVGSPDSTDMWKVAQEPFWKDVFPGLTDGKLTVNSKSWTELGLTGFELMRLLKVGAYDIVSPAVAYISGDDPVMEGADLAGVYTDWDTYRAAIEAYRPIMARQLEEKFDAKLLNVFPWQSIHPFCNGDRNAPFTLDSLKGLKARSFGATYADFMEGVGGTAVAIPVPEIVPSLQKGVVDCAITSTMSAYNMKLFQVTTHDYQVPLGFATSFHAMNLDTWNSLNPETQEVLQAAMKAFEDRIWDYSRGSDQEGIDCLTAGPCPVGDPGQMVASAPTDEEKARIKAVVNDHVVRNWAKRCGTQQCIDDWNATIGKVVGITASLD